VRYMVIEIFTKGPRAVYERAGERGRMIPPGLEYVDSWIDERLDRCFQLMETDDPLPVRPVDRVMGRPGRVRDRAGDLVGRGRRPRAAVSYTVSS